MAHGHKHAEAFLNGSVALFEQLGIKSRSAEAQVELARCYYRQGLFDIARETISAAYSELPDDQVELKNLLLECLGRNRKGFWTFERFTNQTTRGRESRNSRARWYRAVATIDLATTLKELAISEREETLLR